MRSPCRSSLILFLSLCLANLSFASAYNAHPKLIVIVVIDQLRADYLERFRDQFGEGGFRLFLDHGANFTDCNYDYANTRTAPGHATLVSGTYSDGHGIMANEWWDPQKKKMVTSVQDDEVKIVGQSDATPASPHNLRADTLGDELKLATQGKAKVFGLSLKDRSAILLAGFSADGAYWTDPKTGTWITSTYYRPELPNWVQDFNTHQGAQQYWNREWKDNTGHTLRSTAPRNTTKGPGAFAEIIGSTPFANDYEFDFAKQLLTNEHLGGGPVTDLLLISLSANDILGHQVGPDDPQMQAMMLATDHQLADFFAFLGHQLGLANIWLALSADHGISPLPEVATKLRMPAGRVRTDRAGTQLNDILINKLSPGHPVEYLKGFHYPLAWLNEDAFAALKMNEEDSERAVGEAMQQLGLLGYFTRTQLARGEVANSELGRRYLHSYAPLLAWYVQGVPQPYTVGSTTGTDHASPYTYDTHVPLSFYGAAFQTGTYRTHAEPVDLAVTLASLLGINAPNRAIGRVLTEALPPPHAAEHAAHSRADSVEHPQLPHRANSGGMQ
jgi:arylsulfatase A-like enzyme